MLDRLANKYILLDTNVLANGAAYGQYFAPFFDMLKSQNVRAVTSDAIIFEFLRGSNTTEHLTKKSEYLSLLFGHDITQLPVDHKTFETARKIANIYANKDSNTTKQISLVDCLIAAQMQKYNDSYEQLFLVTSDNKDFPLWIFDRIHVHTIDAEKEIFNLGIYCFSQKKYQALVGRFEVSTF